MNVFRIDAIAVSSGIATAGRVPKTKSRMTSAPKPPISVSPSTDGPLLSPFAAAFDQRVAARDVAMDARPAAAAAERAQRRSVAPVDEPKPGCAGPEDLGERRVAVLRDVHRCCRSRSTSWSAPRGSPRPRRRASLLTPAVVRDVPPSTVTTATSGAFSPMPNVFSVRWFASYAGVAGNRERLEPPLRDLAGRKAAERRSRRARQDDDQRRCR